MDFDGSLWLNGKNRVKINEWLEFYPSKTPLFGAKTNQMGHRMSLNNASKLEEDLEDVYL